MRRGHYGIDPRKLGVITPQTINTLPSGRTSQTVSYKKYNPYTTSSTNFSSTLPPRSLSSMAGGPPPAVKAEKGQSKKSPGKTIDKIFELTQKYSLAGAIEVALSDYIPCRDLYVWFDRPSSHRLYSPSLSKSTNYNSSILSFCFTSKEIVSCQKPVLHDHFDPMVDGSDSQLLYVPLKDSEDSVLMILQIRRRVENQTFTQADVNQLMAFANKFKIYARLLIPKNKDPLFTISLAQIPKGKNAFIFTSDKLRHFFVCRQVDIFAIAEDGAYLKLNSNEGIFEKLSGNAGIATTAIKNMIQLNIEHPSKADNYNAAIDGTIDENVLMQPLVSEDRTYCVVLRGPEKRHFNAADGAKLLAFSPVIGRAFANQGIDDTGDALAARLKALLEVAEILSGVLDIDTLVPTIMTRACELLHTERCSLFLIDHEKNELITRFQGGLDKSIRLPLSRGIVGHTATTGNIVNITDPYSDPRFDQSVDKKTGFKTRNLVTVPIYNNRGEIAGVTEMINKIDDGPFNEEDLKMLMAFNVFCGISLDNARLYEASLDLTRQLRSFVDMSYALNKTKSVNDVIEEILTNAKTVIHATRATVFLQQDNQLTPFVSIGDQITHGTLFAGQMKQYMKTTIFDADDVQAIVLSDQMEGNNPELTSQSLKMSKSRTSSQSRVSVVFDSQSSMTSEGAEDKQNQESICIFPLLASDGKLLGVMELSSLSKILPEDAKLIDCFAVFAAISLERSELKEIATLGMLEKKIKEWITPEERTGYDVPEKLKLNSDIYLKLEFDAASFQDMGFFQVIFAIFNYFDLLREFEITNDKFFRFLSEISSTYKKVPYHNWRHAVDVTQYITYELVTSGISQKLSKFDLFALLVAAICHDANHDGFTNVYNVKAETPLGILFKNQSVMETHHCAIAISVISKSETNIFSALKPDEYKKMWSLIISLILATDMAKHFTFLKEVNQLLDENKLTLDDPEMVTYYLQLILKCADISNVSRPFELANRWCDVLCEEFFRQGDLEMAQGMEYTSDLNDRAHLDKPKSQIGFYKFVCLPLFETCAKALPPLQVNVDQINSNLEVWKAQAESNNNNANNNNHNNNNNNANNNENK